MSIQPIGLARTLVIFGLGKVPVVGGLISALTSFLWPSGSDESAQWDAIRTEFQQDLTQLKAQLEQEIAAAIQDQVIADVNADMKSLSAKIGYYTAQLTLKQPEYGQIKSTWTNAVMAFTDLQSRLQETKYQLVLLPQYAQLMTMWASLQRDGVRFGASWGWNQEEVNLQQTTFTDTMQAATTYCQKVYQQYLSTAQQTPPDPLMMQPQAAVDAYVATLTLQVLDYVHIWPYMDAVQYPNGAQVDLDRVIYSAPVGYPPQNSLPYLRPLNGLWGPYMPSRQQLSKLELWNAQNADTNQPPINMIRLTYANGQQSMLADRWAPGTPAGAFPPADQVVNIDPDNPVVTVAGTRREALYTLAIEQQNGSQPLGSVTNIFTMGAVYAYSASFPSQVLCDVTGMELGLMPPPPSFPNPFHSSQPVWNRNYPELTFVRFGFCFPKVQQVESEVLRLLYVTAPAPTTLPEVMSSGPATAVDAPTVAARASAEDWDTQRQTFQQQLQARLAV